MYSFIFQAYCFMYMNSGCNPIIYAWRSPSFREGYKEILCQQTGFIVSDGGYHSYCIYDVYFYRHCTYVHPHNSCYMMLLVTMVMVYVFFFQKKNPVKMFVFCVVILQSLCINVCSLLYLVSFAIGCYSN